MRSIITPYHISYNNEKRKKRNSHLALLNYYWDNRNKTPGGDTDSAKAIDNTIHVIKIPTLRSSVFFNSKGRRPPPYLPHFTHPRTMKTLYSNLPSKSKSHTQLNL